MRAGYADVLKTHRFSSAEDLEQTLLRYVALYNHQLPQSALKSKTPMQAMKEWYKEYPHLFHKRPYDRPGCDRYSIPWVFPPYRRLKCHKTQKTVKAVKPTQSRTLLTAEVKNLTRVRQTRKPALLQVHKTRARRKLPIDLNVLCVRLFKNDDGHKAFWSVRAK